GGTVRGPRLSTFAATRPLNNAALVGAQFRSAVLATAIAWGMVFALVLGWIAITGGYREIPPLWEPAGAEFGLAKAWGRLALLLGLPVLITLRLLVVNLWAGLTGRTWIVSAQMILAGLVSIQALAEFGMSRSDPTRYDAIKDALPWVACGLVVLK